MKRSLINLFTLLVVMMTSMFPSESALAQSCPVIDFGLDQYNSGLRNWDFPASLGVEPGTEAISCVKLVNFSQASHDFSLDPNADDTEYRINNGAWIDNDDTTTFVEGDEIYIRKTASNSYADSDVVYTRINGGWAGIWTVQTANTERAPIVWQVGPGRTHTQLVDIKDQLVAGDLVELDGDATYDPVEFTRSGSEALPITIRGISVNGNRPVISGDISTSKKWAVALNRSHFYRLENLEITEAGYACVRTRAHHVTITDSYIHNCYGNGILSTDSDSGTLIVERTELGFVGNADSTGAVRHGIYSATDFHQHPDAKFVLKHSYIHDFRGNAIKARSNRSEVMFNWIEQTDYVNPSDSQDHSYYTLSLIGPDGKEPDSPIESIVMGNVFEHVTNGNGGNLHLRFGGDGTGYSNGRIHFASNVIITPADLSKSRDILRMQFRMNSFYLRNNMFIRANQTPSEMTKFRLFRQEATWLTGEVLLYGEKNWYPPDTVLETNSSLDQPAAQWAADNSQDPADVAGVFFDQATGVLTIPPENTVLTDYSGVAGNLDSEYQVSGLTDYLDQPYRLTSVRPTKGALADSLVTMAGPVSPYLTYDLDTFVEDSSNDGTSSTMISIQLGGVNDGTGEEEKFAEGPFFSGTHYTVANVPPGMLAEVIRTGDNSVSVALTGAAEPGSRSDANDVSNLTIAFTDSAFTGADASLVTGATQPGLSVDFIDGRLSYASTVFIEDGIDDGSIANSLDITVELDSFSEGPFTSPTHYTVSNLPAGLSASVTRVNDSTATLSLTGNAQPHGPRDGVSNLSLTFTDAAFSGSDASSIVNAQRDDLVVNFIVGASITYDDDVFREHANNDGTIQNKLVLTLHNETFSQVLNSPEHYALVLPEPAAGLTGSLTRDSDTQVTVELIGTADAPVNANDVANVFLKFTDKAFAGLNASHVKGSTRTDIGIDFFDASISYSTTDFFEASSNDGAISTVLVASLSSDTFVEGEISSPTHYTLSNVPAGLTPVLTRVDDTLLTVGFAGAATFHSAADDVLDMELVFNDAAFAGGNAASVTNANNQTLHMYFTDPPNAPTVFSEDTQLAPGQIIDNALLLNGVSLSGGGVTGSLQGEGVVSNILLDIDSIDEGIEIGASTQVTAFTIDNNVGLELSPSLRLSDGSLDIDFPLLIDSNDEPVSVGAIIENQVDQYLSVEDTRAVSIPGKDTLVIQHESFGEAIILTRPTSIAAGDLAAGLWVTAAGDLEISSQGIRSLLVPVAWDLDAIVDTVTAAGGDATRLDEGILQLTDIDPTLSFRFGYVLDISQSEGFVSALNEPAIITRPDTAAIPEDYSIIVAYPDGNRQDILPYFHAFDSFRALVNSVGYTLRVNAISGVVELLDESQTVVFRCLPAFDLIESGGQIFGSSVEFADDLNGDGHLDYYFVTPEWTQALYALPLFPGPPAPLQ